VAAAGRRCLATSLVVPPESCASGVFLLVRGLVARSRRPVGSNRERYMHESELGWAIIVHFVGHYISNFGLLTGQYV
jgi:hypothetical protein